MPELGLFSLTRIGDHVADMRKQWIDRKSGVAATFFTQVMPANDPRVPAMVLELETALYKSIRGS